MAIWLSRAGKMGEHEQRFLEEGKIILTWQGLTSSLRDYPDRQGLFDYMLKAYPNEKRNAIRNYVGQVAPFASEMQIGDWVVLPSKLKASIHIGEIIGDYQFDKKSDPMFAHSRKVKWFATDIPRSNFDQDILYSFGAFMTVCRISRNNAEERIRKMAQNKWKSTDAITISDAIPKTSSDESGDFTFNLEEIANDQIAKLIIRKFKGDRLEWLIQAILKAKGYVIYRSPKGRDKTVDLLAAPEPMGFGRPRILVQVKSGEEQQEAITLQQLSGAMQDVQADQGLLVSWYGFKSSVKTEEAKLFFKIRLWSEKEIITEFLEQYDLLEEAIRSEIPLKKVWTLAIGEEV